MKRRMNRGSRRMVVFVAFRDFVDRFGRSPTVRELGDLTGMSSIGAWKHVQALIGDGLLVKYGHRAELPGHIDLVGVTTRQMRAELARRGVTMDALERPKLPFDEGRPCAANHCLERVERGMLMCREHWFALPPRLRSAIMNAWSARNTRAYQAAVEAARDHLGGFTRVMERVG